MDKRFNRFIYFLIAFATITACAPPFSWQHPTQIPGFIDVIVAQTAAAAATNTAAAIPTRTPTPLTPTPTIVPPSFLSDYLKNVEVLSFDSFDTNIGWNPDNGTVTNGVLEIKGDNQWNTVRREDTLSLGEGIILKFKHNIASEFEIYFDHGSWNTDDYRRFGVYLGNHPQVNLWQGSNCKECEDRQGDFQPLPDTWYNLFMVIGDSGKFMAILWDPNDISKALMYRGIMGETWTGLEWNFAIGVNKGTILIDDFSLFSFTTIK